MRRYMPLAEAQISDSVEQDAQYLTGIACVYNALSRPLPLSNGRKFRERIAPDAFTSSLGAEDILCTVNHDAGKVLGRTSNNTVEIFNNAEHLKIRCKLPKTTYAADLLESVRRGDIQGMSFTFDNKDVDTEWMPDAAEDGLPVCTIKRGYLYEVCFTSDPAYMSTSVAMRDAGSIRFKDAPVVDVENFNDTLRYNFLRFGIPFRG